MSSGDAKQGARMDIDEAYKMGVSRESWCAVEMKKEQDWCRATRQHYKEHLKSSLFTSSGPVESEPRCNWAVNAPTHRQKKHFEQTYNDHLKL